MLTEPVATREGKPMTDAESDAEFDAYVTRLALVAIVKRRGPIAIPVAWLLEAAEEDLQWDRVGENLVLRVGDPCLK